MKFVVLFLFAISQVFALTNHGDEDRDKTCKIEEPTTARHGENGDIFWCSDYYEQTGGRYRYLWLIRNKSGKIQTYDWKDPRQQTFTIYNHGMDASGEPDSLRLTFNGPPAPFPSSLKYGRTNYLFPDTQFWFGQSNKDKSIQADINLQAQTTGNPKWELAIDSSVRKNGRKTEVTLALLNTSKTYSSSIDLAYHGKNLIEEFARLVEEKKMDPFEVKEEEVEQVGNAMELVHSSFQLASLQQQPRSSQTISPAVRVSTTIVANAKAIKEVIDKLRRLRPGTRLTIAANAEKRVAMGPLQVSFLEHKKAVAGAIIPAFLPQ